MIHRISGALAALALIASFSTPVLANDAAKAQNGMMKSSSEKGELKTVTCDTPCDFKVSSRDEKELIQIVKQHAKKKHNMNLTDQQVKEKIKTEQGESTTR